MSEQSPPSSPGSGRRRSSFTELFIPRPTPGMTPGMQSSSHSPPNAITSPPKGNPRNHRRGMSITTLGLSGNSPNNQNSPLHAFAKQRRASVASSSASGSPEFRNSFEDNAVIEEDGQMGAPATTPATPSFARRVSFGAQALRDVRNTSGASGGEGFNWSEALRDRTKRQPSISASNNPFQNRPRAASTTTVEPPKEMPKPQSIPVTARLGKPDQLGERMLRGDFMMD